MGTHQRGRIYEASGRFYVQYRTGIKPQRKQVSHCLCNKDDRHRSTTDKSVKLLRDEFMLTINAQQEQAPGQDMRVIDFWDRYAAYCEEVLPITGQARLKPATMRGYRQIWNQHLKAHFGQTTLQSYDAYMAGDFLKSLTATQGKTTISHIRALGSAIFAHAVEERRIKANPWTGLKMPKDAVDGAPTQHYTLEQAEDIISALVDRVDCQLVMALSCFLGLRPGEIAALRWEDFDGENVHIRRSLVCGVIGTPKTPESLASLPLINRVRIPLELWRQKSPDVSGWVFPTGNGTPDLHNLVGRVIKPTLKAKGIAWKGLYAGRRGAGTLIIERTGNAAVGQALLRHKNMATTLTFYKKQISEGALREGMKLLEGDAE